MPKDMASKYKCTDVSAKGTGTLMTVDKKSWSVW
jgi:hypothetical protein